VEILIQFSSTHKKWRIQDAPLSDKANDKKTLPGSYLFTLEANNQENP